MRKFFQFLLAAVAVAVGLSVAGCSSQADTVSENLSKDADAFKIERKIVFFNGITDKYLLVIEGKCSLGNHDDEDTLTVTCKTDDDEYKKHFLGLSDNVSYFVEQTESAPSDPFHYKVVFRPQTVVPDIDLQTTDDPEN